MRFKSYLGKVFVVESNKAVVCDDKLREQKFKAGDELPPGKKVGDLKIIPQRTEITVKDVKADSGRHTFVLAVSKDTGEVLGWTSAMMLEGGFKNETLGLAPAKWDLEPNGKNMTCVDAKALIRGGPPDFASKGVTIPSGSFVAVTETSKDGKFVKVSALKIVENEMELGEELGWTAASNLREGCSAHYFTDEWTNKKGPNACWRQGKYIGAKLLVDIVGFGAELEQITLDSLDAYLKLANAAAADNIQLSINSAFRTFARQAVLRELFEKKKGNKAAKPGSSNHQHGQAFDLNTKHNVTNGTDPVYEWLKKNGPKLGFVRTVSDETWHWEYLPDEAPALAAAGKFKLASVKDTI